MIGNLVGIILGFITFVLSADAMIYNEYLVFTILFSIVGFIFPFSIGMALGWVKWTALIGSIVATVSFPFEEVFNGYILSVICWGGQHLIQFSTRIKPNSIIKSANNAGTKWQGDYLSSTFNSHQKNWFDINDDEEDEELDSITILAFASVSAPVLKHKQKFKGKQWAILWSNGDLDLVEKGNTRKPTSAIAADGDNIINITNTFNIKSVEFKSGVLTLNDYELGTINFIPDPTTESNLKDLRKFQNQVKRFI